MDLVQEVLNCIDGCLLPKLSRNLEECDNHPEFQLWEKNLALYHSKLNDYLNDLDFCKYSDNSAVISSLLILYHELGSDGVWQSEKAKHCCKVTKIQFETMYNISLEKLLTYENNNICNTQEVFDKIMELIHKQLTHNDFKKYPALIAVYHNIILNLKEYEVIHKPTSLLPLSLLLIDDFINENKIKGLQCCSSILSNLTQDNFHGGNYYEVIYGVLKKNITEKDLDVVTLVLDCLLNLFKIMPSGVKVTTMDNTFDLILGQLYTETNLYKKKSLFSFVNKLIPLHGVHCVKRRMFLIVICDNLDICSNVSVAEILLREVVESLENWTRYNWCIWRLQSNFKILLVLIKILYVHCEDEKISTRLQNILMTLIKLRSVEEQKQIFNNLKSKMHVKVFKECFVKKLAMIMNNLNDNIEIN
ncbi:hypothetical protein evm_011316 [Chilo suppressalis]|nr:hypothetical protein evm_011316 [Chilo suppressalis]